MADLSFYQSKYSITTQERAFEKFSDTLQSYYDANFYVNWLKVFESTKKYEREFALLSTLCNKPDKQNAARELLEAYPQIIPALPVLIACRGTVTLVENGKEAKVTAYDFIHRGSLHNPAEAERYAGFLVASGIIELLEHIKSVPDYVTGVEVGMDTNARKNRGGECGILAITPWIVHAQQVVPSLKVKQEATYDFLRAEGFSMPDSCRGLKWDCCFWLDGKHDRLVVMEVNHYGGSGSKPPAIAREYAGRHSALKESGIGFIWVTDGLGWNAMKNPLREAFAAIDFMINIKLASEGQLEAALRKLLS